MALKWILQSGEIRFGNVEFHRQLNKGSDPIIGGGLFHLDPDTKEPTILILYGMSHDFGQITEEDFMKATLNLNRLHINSKTVEVYFSNKLFWLIVNQEKVLGIVKKRIIIM